MSSGEVQPRRRRDKKKKKAQLEALAKVEWEEGAALYGADEGHDDEDIVEPIRDSSSSGDEEEVDEDSGSTQSMTYKIIFFILLLLLGGVATLVLVENNTSAGENEGDSGGLETFPDVSPVTEDPIQSSILSDTNERHSDAEEKKDDPANWIEEFNFLESISSLLGELVEVATGFGQDSSHQSQTQDEEVESTTAPSDTSNKLGEIEEEFDEITEEVVEEKIERQEGSVLLEEQMIQIPISKLETQIEPPVTEPESQISDVVTELESQIEHPVTEPEIMIEQLQSKESLLSGDRRSDSSEQQQHQWQSSYSLEDKEPIISWDNSKESFNYLNPETLGYDHTVSMSENQEALSDLDRSPPSESQKDEFDNDFSQVNPKSNGNVLEDEIFDDDEIML